MKAVRVTTFVLGVAVLYGSTANAQIINGGFETGDLTGWYSQGAVQAVGWEYPRDFMGLDQAPYTVDPDWGDKMWYAADGDYFASLWSQEEDFFFHTDSILRQTFTTPDAGWRLDFDYFYDFGDEQGYWATALIIVMDGMGNPIWWRSINAPGVGTGLADDENVDWTSVSVFLPSAGTYHLEFSIDDHPFGGFESILGVDNVALVPVPGAVLLGAIGLGFANWRLRRRRAS